MTSACNANSAENDCFVGHLCDNCVHKLKRDQNLKKMKELFPLTDEMKETDKRHQKIFGLAEGAYHNFHLIEIMDDLLKYLRNLP